MFNLELFNEINVSKSKSVPKTSGREKFPIFVKDFLQWVGVGGCSLIVLKMDFLSHHNQGDENCKHRDLS